MQFAWYWRSGKDMRGMARAMGAHVHARAWLSLDLPAENNTVYPEHVTCDDKQQRSLNVVKRTITRDFL